MKQQLPPSIPRNLREVKRNDGYIEIHWDPNPQQEHISAYNVHRGGIRDFVVSDDSLIAQPSTSDFIDVDVMGSTTYYYRVIAVDADGNKSNPSQVISAKTPLDRILKDVSIWSLGGILVLFLIWGIYNNFIFDGHGFILTIDGSPTFTNDGLSGIISNKDEPRTLTIYGIEKNSTPVVNVSLLTDEDARVNLPIKVEWANNSIGPKDRTGSTREILLSVNRSDIQPGKFQGIVTIRDDKTDSIIIILSTNPMTIQAAIIVGIGILSSVILWEFIKYFKKNNDEQERQQFIERSNRDSENALRHNESYNSITQQKEVTLREFNILNTYAIRERSLIHNIQNNNINQLPQDVRTLVDQLDNGPAVQELNRTLQPLQERLDSLRAKISNFNVDAENHNLKASLYAKSAETNKEAAVKKTQQTENYKSRGLRKRSLAIKIIITEFGSAIFGISIGLFGLLQNDYVMGLRTLGTLEFTILFGLGLSIGSLKEFVDK